MTNLARTPLVLPILLGTLVLPACGSDAASEDASAGSGSKTSANDGTVSPDAVDQALEAASPDGRVDVPSADGAVSLSEYSSGAVDYEPTDPNDLAMLLTLLGSQAKGYITSDNVVVVESTKADATMLCLTAETAGIDSYTIMPMLEDGSGVDCD